ncbi:MAG: PIN domain-containing protein [Spirochaetaceae bacterium]|nr:PIN domain-containing protein [Spirochaetaceae bacterium]
MFSYFDSSVLLSILLDEERKEEAYSFWKSSKIRVSSILLKIESIIVLRRIYEQYKTRVGNNWLKKKTEELEHFLNEVNYRIIDEEIEKIISLKKELSKCRTLDAIHIATALEFREIADGENINLYSFDTSMHELAKAYKFKTNKL